MEEHPSPEMPDWPQGTIFTVGHSTLTLERFVDLLRTYHIERLADIRSIPRSRRNPQFNADTLPAALAEHGIEYRSMPELGGLRHPRRDSPNAGWRNDSFRGYADYMQTPAFAEAVEALIRAGREKRTAIMCAEAVPWRCHRSLVADALLVREAPVVEILSDTDWRPHKLTGFAAVDGLSITYPAEQRSLL
jgi:uncharacterized protein (DUF488 family)